MEGTGAFGEKMNSMPKYVASRTLTSATWDATIIEGDVADAVRGLKADYGGDLLIGGSGQLIDYLTGHDLIDEYRLMVHPIVLGNGTKRLFTAVPQADAEPRRDHHVPDRRRRPNLPTGDTGCRPDRKDLRWMPPPQRPIPEALRWARHVTGPRRVTPPGRPLPLPLNVQIMDTRREGWSDDRRDDH